MNSTPNATEIRFSEPIASAANPAFKASPAQTVTRIARTSLTERTAAIENQADHHQRQDGRSDRALLQRRELLVIERDRSGQAHPQPVLRVDVQLARQAPYFGAGAAARLERVEIEHRPRQDEAAQLAPVGREPGHQALPRDRVRCRRPEPPAPRWLRPLRVGSSRSIAALVVIRFGTPDEQLQRVEQAAQARIARQRADQRLRLDQSCRKYSATRRLTGTTARCGRRIHRRPAGGHK